VDAAIAREWDVPEQGEHYPFKLTQIVGLAPNPIEPIAAAMQGNSWILGLSDTVDPRLAKFVTQPTSEEALLADLPDFSDLDESEQIEDGGYELVIPEAPRRKHRKASVLQAEG
jgi:hypothetical protein